METAKKKILIFQETKTLKELLIFQEMKLFSLPQENSLYFRKRKPYINLYFLKRKLFLYFGKRKPSFSYFSKLKYFLIITIKRFFSFDNIFFYTEQAFVFHLLREFYNVLDHILTFFLFIL